MTQAKSLYITPQGYRTLQAERDSLWQRRREVVKHLAAAAAEGDRSENAEYIYRKKQLRELDRRIRYLQRRLPELKVSDRLPADPGRVYFGARVRLEDDAGNAVNYRIVGSDEFDLTPDGISIDSPVARALLGRSLEEEVEVRVPSGSVRYCIIAVEYPRLAAS